MPRSSHTPHTHTYAGHVMPPCAGNVHGRWLCLTLHALTAKYVRACVCGCVWTMRSYVPPPPPPPPKKKQEKTARGMHALTASVTKLGACAGDMWTMWSGTAALHRHSGAGLSAHHRCHANMRTKLVARKCFPGDGVGAVVTAGTLCGPMHHQYQHGKRLPSTPNGIARRSCSMCACACACMCTRQDTSADAAVGKT